MSHMNIHTGVWEQLDWCRDCGAEWMEVAGHTTGLCTTCHDKRVAAKGTCESEDIVACDSCASNPAVSEAEG